MFPNQFTQGPQQIGPVGKIVLENSTEHFHHWMRLQESINRDIADELQKLRDEIQKLKEGK